MKALALLALIVLVGCGDGKESPAITAPRAAPKSYPVVIQVDGPQDDETAINSWIAKLQAATSNGIPSPFLEDNFYNGHIFWDADMWVFPALCFLDPDKAKVIPEFRLKQKPPIPWESAKDGRIGDPPVAKRHRSQTGSALWMLRRAQALGLVPSIEPFRSQAREYYISIMQRSVRATRGADIKGVKSIDEYAEEVDNDLYTNLVAQIATGIPFELPRDRETFLTYEGDRMRTYQQAAAVLAIFPLQVPTAEKEAPKMMDRFAGKVTQNGPAMSDSIHATIYARLGKTEKAYEEWRKSWRDFQRSKLPAEADTPIDLEVFSEYRTQKRSYFLTGAAGCLNAVLYGFCGFRIDSQKQPGAAWSKQINGGYWLSIKPNLPKQWRRVTVPFTLLGKKYTLVATHERVAVN